MVAEKVMGWRWFYRPGWYVNEESHLVEPHKAIAGDAEFFMSETLPAKATKKFLDYMPAYSTDPAAAWQVVEKMRNDGWIVEIEQNTVPESVCKMSKYRGPAHYCTAQSMPRAVAVAALLALAQPTQAGGQG